MCLILHRTLAVFVALIALLAVIISPIVVGLYADVRNWNDSEDGELRWCHDDAKMRDSAANLGLAAGCVSFVVGLVLIPFILVTVLGAVISCCRPNLVTSFLLPIPVFLLSLVLFGLYASVVATTSRQFEEKKDWLRPSGYIDPETKCSEIPPKWNAALAWAVIEAALFAFIMLYSLLWMFLGCFEKRTSELEAGTPMQKMPKEKKQKPEKKRSVESSDSSDSSDESDDELRELRDDLKDTLHIEYDQGDHNDAAELAEVEKALKKAKVYKRRKFLKQTEADLKKAGLSAAATGRLLALIASEKNKEKDRKRRRDRGYLMVDLDDALKSIFDENDPKDKKDLDDVRSDFRRLRITDLDFFLNMTEKEFKELEVSLPVKNKLRQKMQELRAQEEV